MKNLVLLSSLLFAIPAFACPDLTGSYLSPSKESIVLEQVECAEIAVESKDINRSLLLNNQYVLVQEDATMEAHGKGLFVDDVLVLEVKIKYKISPPLPKMFIPVRAVNNYTKMNDGNLLEVSRIYNEMNGVLTSSKTIYKKQ